MRNTLKKYKKEFFATTHINQRVSPFSFFRWLVHLFLFPRVTSGRWKTGGIRTSERERSTDYTHCISCVCVFPFYFLSSKSSLNTFNIFSWITNNQMKESSPTLVTQPRQPLLFFLLSQSQNDQVVLWQARQRGGTVGKIGLKYWQRVIN